MRTRIKICGVRDVETALVAAECGADAIGLVFAPGSVRRVDADAAWEIACALPPFVARVGLFVDPALDEFERTLEECPLDMAQLHGNEDEAKASACGPRVIKAVVFDEASIEREFERWAAVPEVEAILVDGSAGGEGTAFNWRALAKVRDRCVQPLILAGGLTPENVGEAIRILEPWAVDVSSGVESSRGVKDAGLIQAFCEAVHEADSR
jgi:phosphoribosylanthranilate isomerase